MVTGGSGYIAGFVIAQLLAEGYEVRATVRAMHREPEIRASLSRIAPDQTRLRFFAADLTNDQGWAAATDGVDFVQHIASPVAEVMPRNEDELIRPAREGALRTLRFARDGGVKRLVMTSSTAAVTYGQSAPPRRPFTETDWTDENSPDTNAYIRSKAIAEKAAWAFLAAEGGALEMTTVNPAAVLGPVLGSDYSASIQIVQKLLNGDFPGSPRLGFPLVDVRDIADLHVRAMTSPVANGERFLGSGDFLWMEEISRILREHLGEEARKCPRGKLPDFLVKALAIFDPVTRGVVFELGKRRPVDCAKARIKLGWVPRPAQDSILDTARSLLSQGLVKG